MSEIWSALITLKKGSKSGHFGSEEWIVFWLQGSVPCFPVLIYSLASCWTLNCSKIVWMTERHCEMLEVNHYTYIIQNIVSSAIEYIFISVNTQSCQVRLWVLRLWQEILRVDIWLWWNSDTDLYCMTDIIIM